MRASYSPYVTTSPLVAMMKAGWSARSMAYFPGYMGPMLARQMPTMRSGGGATGEFAARYWISASRSSPPPTRFVPWRNTVKASPPSARKLFVVTR